MSQLNFFSTQDEILSKVNTILCSGEFIVFNGTAFNTRTPEPVSELSQVTGFKNLTLWIKNSHRNPLCSSIGSGELAGKFLFDHYKDPVIEIENCSYRDNLVSPGRVYFKAGWVEEEELRKLHQKLGNKVFRVFDKDSLRVEKLWRVSPEVKSWVSQGVELELGINGKRVTKENLSIA